jgi:hypothetical protein
VDLAQRSFSRTSKASAGRGVEDRAEIGYGSSGSIQMRYGRSPALRRLLRDPGTRQQRDSYGDVPHVSGLLPVSCALRLAWVTRTLEINEIFRPP